MFQVQVEPIP